MVSVSNKKSSTFSVRSKPKKAQKETNNLSNQPKDDPSNKQENFFDCDVKSYQESLTYTKKIIAMAVSNIAYLRTLWPDEFFVTRYFEKIELKIIESHSHQQTRTLAKWILGVFDALEKKYLRQFTFSLHLDPNNPEEVLETYEFNITYNDKVNLDISVGREQRKQKIHSSSIRFIRHLMYAAKMLKEFPQNGYMNLRLFYYDDITPADYEPPGFKSSDLADFRFPDGRVELPVGRVNSFWHALDFNVNVSKSLVQDYEEYERAGEEVVAEQHGDKDKEETWMRVSLKGAKRVWQPKLASMDDSQLSAADNSIVDSSHGPDQMTAADVNSMVKRIEGLTVEPAGQNILEKKSSFPYIDSSNKEKPNDELQDPKMVCECGLTDEESGLILLECLGCRSKQHSVCYRIWIGEDEDLSEWLTNYKHYCRKCYQQLDDPKPRQIDRAIYESDESVVKRLCLVRRIVHWMWQLDGAGFNPKMISSHFTIDLKMVMAALNDLRDLVKISSLKKKGWLMVPKSDLNKTINDCFSQPVKRLQAKKRLDMSSSPDQTVELDNAFGYQTEKDSSVDEIHAKKKLKISISESTRIDGFRAN